MAAPRFYLPLPHSTDKETFPSVWPQRGPCPMHALPQGPHGLFLWIQRHELQWASNVHQEQVCVSSVLPQDCPIKMMGDHMELHEVREYQGRHGVHFQGALNPLAWSQDRNCARPQPPRRVGLSRGSSTPPSYNTWRRWSPFWGPPCIHGWLYLHLVAHPGQHPHGGWQHVQKHFEPNLHFQSLPHMGWSGMSNAILCWTLLNTFMSSWGVASLCINSCVAIQ